MVPDLRPDEAARLCADFEIKGAGIDIKRKGLALNPVGATRYRIEEDGDSPLDKLSFDPVVSGDKLDFTMHTWLASGKHLDIVEGKDIPLGNTFSANVRVDKDGNILELAIALRFYSE